MRWLIRTVTRKRQGAVSTADDTYTGDTLTIGRGAGQAVFLSDLKVSLEHARIVRLKSGRFRVESLTAAGIRVDGKLQQAAGAGVGSRIEIGDNLIEIVDPPPGHDAAVQVSQLEASTQTKQRRRLTRPSTLKDTWLRKRGPAWALFLLFLAIGLLIPMLGYLVPGMQSTLRAAPAVPSDNLWEAGTLQAAHHFFGEDCSMCHQQAFQRVRDEACVACHARTPGHAEAELFALPELEETPCAICHRDHNGLDSLVNARQRLCTDCHASLSEDTHGTTVLADVNDFDLDHPQFKVELAGWDALGNYQPRRESLDSETLSEESNLIFPHDKHLNPEGLNAPSGERVLACGDCHQVEPGGAKMVPVAFETMCHECHGLGFDPASPGREVPHGDAAEVLYMLQEFYTNKALRGAVTEGTAPESVRKRRRPGERVSREERMEILDWANERAQRVGQSLFEGQACGVCHRVSRLDTGEGVTWKVEPVRVAGEWFSKALFTHKSHTTMDCESCHEARLSTSSNDVLMPRLDDCRDCHGGESSHDKVATPCIDCHRYHGREDIVLARGR